MDEKIKITERIMKKRYETGTHGDYLKKQLRIVQETMYLLNLNLTEEQIIETFNKKKI